MTLSVQGNIWLANAEGRLLIPKQLTLLEKIAEHGSMTKAARAAGISYKAAWEMIETMNNLSERLVVERTTGGKGGGGSQLTAYGQELVLTYQTLQAEHQQFLAQLTNRLSEYPELYQFLQYANAQTTASNQFVGTIVDIQNDDLNCEVSLQLSGGERLTVLITSISCQQLNLKLGDQVFALIPATHIVLTHTEDNSQLSCRNRLNGHISRWLESDTETLITLALSGGNSLKAVLTNETGDSFPLQRGLPLIASFKASAVILAAFS